MTQTKMPEPVAWMLAYQTMGGDVGWKLSWTQSGAGVCHRLSGESHEKPLITTAQAEAYAAAKVREALEEAAAICQQEGDEWGSDGVRPYKNYAHACRDRIRALIPTDSRPGQP